VVDVVVWTESEERGRWWREIVESRLLETVVLQGMSESCRVPRFPRVRQGANRLPRSVTWPQPDRRP